MYPRQFNLICRTTYYTKESITWHESFKRHAVEIVEDVQNVGPLSLTFYTLVVDGRAYRIIGTRAGLEGRVVAIIIDDVFIRCLYTDIPIGEITEDDRMALRKYGDGEFTRG